MMAGASTCITGYILWADLRGKRLLTTREMSEVGTVVKRDIAYGAGGRISAHSRAFSTTSIFKSRGAKTYRG